MHTLNDFTFDTLVLRYRQPLTGAAYHLCGDREAACDIVQDTLVDAYRGFAGLREPEKAGAWLYAILRRKVIGYRRSRRPEVELLEERVVAGPEDAESLVRGIVIEQMLKLAEEDREILAGKYLLGLSYKELADSLGIKEGAVRVRCLRAKERLREILRGAGVKVPEKR
ncbi:MAG: RNA polymerase sigma factor [Armatimonadota bacterium]|nr:RNA polymerase sigma factor [Armatimonadota bacterium]